MKDLCHVLLGDVSLQGGGVQLAICGNNYNIRVNTVADFKMSSAMYTNHQKNNLLILNQKPFQSRVSKVDSSILEFGRPLMQIGGSV